MADPLEIRCECRRKALLALAGRDKSGSAYLHVKSHKGQRLYAEILVSDGIVRLRCRECLRWTKVIVRREVAVSSDEVPESVELADKGGPGP